MQKIGHIVFGASELTLFCLLKEFTQGWSIKTSEQRESIKLLGSEYLAALCRYCKVSVGS
ncbi:hypothetical protein N9O24_00365 [bacterium]|nr:hypothetical protein [bacterium]